jgi:hypothetical protein
MGIIVNDSVARCVQDVTPLQGCSGVAAPNLEGEGRDSAFVRIVFLDIALVHTVIVRF